MTGEDTSAGAVGEVLARLGRIAALHTPARRYGRRVQRCSECGQPWPCPTYDLAARPPEDNA